MDTVKSTHQTSLDKRREICNVINEEIFINESFLDPEFTAGKLCKLHNINPPTLSTVMSTTYAESFPTLLQRLRTNKACIMLADSRFDPYTCEEIGLMCGFASRQSYYNAFVRIHSVTPLEYRRQHQSNE